MTDWGDVNRRWDDRRTVALAASIPEWGDAELLADLEEAVVSTTRAVLAAEAVLAVAADLAIAGLVASVAAEYTLPWAAEVARERRPPPPVRLFVDALDQTSAAELLSAFASRGVASLEGERRGVEFDGRRAVWRLLESVEPVGGLVIGSSEEAVGDIEAMREHRVQVAAIVPNADPELLARSEVRDPVREALDFEVVQDRQERGGVRRDVTPYPFIVQLLVRGWLDEERRILA